MLVRMARAKTPRPVRTKKAPKHRYEERWERSASGAALCALLHDDRGWLMHLPDPGAAGASSRDSDYDGPRDAMLDFRLSNGQVDSYPVAWTLPRETIERALAYFRRTGERPPFITWHED
jgi:hypothetical protein